MRLPPSKRLAVGFALVACAIFSCVTQGPGSAQRHRWWSGLGPVLPHDTFPADCNLCHVGQDWNDLVRNFEFDHERETGVPLNGAHAQAGCLRCHNDRGPVDVFAAKGCAGCHEDYHFGELNRDCTSCHNEVSWYPSGQVAMHNRTRFPLTGAHAGVACHRCHPGGWVGEFIPTDNECVTCHRDDLAGAINPPHIPLGWVDRCNRCHLPTRWNQAETRQ
ncbi:MAG: hypothetical protein AAF628_10120 [Planctomycetota bacterium]